MTSVIVRGGVECVVKVSIASHGGPPQGASNKPSRYTSKR